MYTVSAHFGLQFKHLVTSVKVSAHSNNSDMATNNDYKIGEYFNQRLAQRKKERGVLSSVPKSTVLYFDQVMNEQMPQLTQGIKQGKGSMELYEPLKKALKANHKHKKHYKSYIVLVCQIIDEILKEVEAILGGRPQQAQVTVDKPTPKVPGSKINPPIVPPYDPPESESESSSSESEDEDIPSPKERRIGHKHRRTREHRKAAFFEGINTFDSFRRGGGLYSGGMYTPFTI